MALRFAVLAIDNIPAVRPRFASTRRLLLRRPIHVGFFTKIAAFDLARLFKEQPFDALSLCPSPVFDFRR